MVDPTNVMAQNLWKGTYLILNGTLRSHPLKVLHQCHTILQEKYVYTGSLVTPNFCD